MNDLLSYILGSSLNLGKNNNVAGEAAKRFLNKSTPIFSTPNRKTDRKEDGSIIRQISAKQTKGKTSVDIQSFKQGVKD